MLIFSAALLVGFLLLVWGADRFVLGAGASARNLGISPLMIGLTIVAFATSLPEVLVSITASLQDAPGLAIGNAVGSNIANIALVLGVTAIVCPITLGSDTLRREIPALLAVTLLLAMLSMDGYLGRTDGYVLMAGLGLLLYWIAKLGFRSASSDPIRQEYEDEIPSDVKMSVAVAWLVLGLAVLLLGANILVWGAEEIARALGVDDIIIGLTIVAVGTSLPELAVTVVSALKNEHGLAIGNIIGSNMFNTLAVVGPAAAIHPITLGARMQSLHLPVMIGLTLVMFAMTYDFSGRGKLHRAEGIALVAAFASYHYYTFSSTL
jgi:cation:H+ antiporter